MIQLEDIELNLGHFALQNIHLTIKKNDFFALIGPTGSGKSLLLEVIMGLMPVTGGQIRLEGRDITRIAVEKRPIAIVYQDFALFPHLNVTQNICYGVPYHNIPRKTATSSFDDLVATLGLEKILSRHPHNLSGGEKQRVALARSLILKPDVLLLDEPLSALDPIYHEGAKQLLKKIHDNMDITIVMVSHNFSDVLYLANQGAVIKNGTIMQQGDIIALFERPDSEFTASFVGMKNIHPIQRIENQKVFIHEAVSFSADLSPDKAHRFIGIRPENIQIIENGTLMDNVFSGTIRNIWSTDIYLNLSIQSGDVQFEAVWPRTYIKDYRLSIGKTVRFGFHADAIHSF